VLQCGAVWCSVLQRGEVCCSVMQCVYSVSDLKMRFRMRVCVLQCVALFATCCSVSNQSADHNV